MLTVLRANSWSSVWVADSLCSLTNEAFKGITFTHESPLRKLFLTNQCKVDTGWTELFNGLCSSCITTLDLRDNKFYGEEECCTALKFLLIKSKTITVLRIGGSK